MEIILSIATILGGITAIWFFIDKFKESKKEKNLIKPLNQAQPTQKQNIESKVYGATQSGRQPFFINEPKSDYYSVVKEAKKQNKLIFLVIYDEEHPTKSKLFYSLGCFMDYFTTKKLVEDYFITALISSKNNDITKFIPDDDPLENSLLVILNQNEEVIKREGVYANPDEGLKRIRSIIKTNV